MQALNLCTLRLLWLWRACLRVSLALWWVFSITEVQPTVIYQGTASSLGHQQCQLIKSFSFIKKHTLANGFLQESAWIPCLGCAHPCNMSLFQVLKWLLPMFLAFAFFVFSTHGPGPPLGCGPHGAVPDWWPQVLCSSGT